MGFNNPMKWPEFFTKDCDLPTNGLSILCRNPARVLHGEPIELTVGLSGTSGLWIFGSPYRWGGLLWYRVNFCFRSVGKAALCFERSFCTFLWMIFVGSLDSGLYTPESSRWFNLSCIQIHPAPQCSYLYLLAKS
jgi:hypothetical protein